MRQRPVRKLTQRRWLPGDEGGGDRVERHRLVDPKAFFWVMGQCRQGKSRPHEKRSLSWVTKFRLEKSHFRGKTARKRKGRTKTKRGGGRGG